MTGGTVTEAHSGKAPEAGSRKRMGWSGKLVGAGLGLLGGPVGAAIGLLIGHQYDLATARAEGPTDSTDPAAISAALFETAFAVMGYLAKADGRVSEAEVDAARGVMRDLRLDPIHVRRAIDAFTRGKDPQYPLEAELDRLRGLCRWRPDLLRFFMEIELRAALAGNDLGGPVRALLIGIGERLGVSRVELSMLESALRGQRRSGASATPPPAGARLAMAYETLGVTPTAGDADVKKAYRRLMSENHPDKLVSRGLPESMQELAKEKTQRIREAYETICERRGIR
jgi:DnaJ like chaperone protein